jgi:hypothetical protein
MSHKVTPLRDSCAKPARPTLNFADGGKQMQTPAFPSLQSNDKSFTNRGSDRTPSTGFFEAHPVGEVVRSLFFSSILWMLLAIALYAVYSMVVGSR